MSPSFTYRITKYDPADFAESGAYNGAEEEVSDHGPVEAAYLAAVAAFAEASGVERLEVREPEVPGFVNFGLEAPVEGHGLSGLFPPDLTGYHDGAEVSVPVALELVRAMLRDNGAWCRLEAGNAFTVHVGYDQYVYVGSDRPCAKAVARTREFGLFPVAITASPWAVGFDDEDDEAVEVADEGFWERVRAALDIHKELLMEETCVRHASRWHRLTPGNLKAVLAELGPRSLVTIWPGLESDVRAVVAALPEEEPGGLVWEEPDGTLRYATVDDTGYPELVALTAGARAARCLPPFDERSLSLCAALPDSDGVLRARW
ncbi:RNA-binding protein [Streptomyces sp. NPDC005426]|uniref:RNA-binding protein n=1 Tax=Streptomyces sp. NPDC005426 TaxID=3155344 RepID=UPI0033ABEE07